jgi:hypothetical protein
MKNLEEDVMLVENRMWPRIKCQIETQCSAFPHRWDCKIVDLSERGVGIITEMNPKNMQKGAVVEFRNPRARAKVIWLKNNRVGLRVIN